MCSVIFETCPGYKEKVAGDQRWWTLCASGMYGTEDMNFVDMVTVGLLDIVLNVSSTEAQKWLWSLYMSLLVDKF